jgi:hypothetical protein
MSYCIIASSRGIKSLLTVAWTMRMFFQDHPEFRLTHVISGGANGIDDLGRMWAEDRGLPCIHMPALWNIYGKKAGMIRNVEMAKLAQAAVIIWDGYSRGTQHMIETALEHKLLVRVHTLDGQIYDSSKP